MTLVFEPNLSGHRLEYLHHLHEAALKDYAEDYIFVAPSHLQETSLQRGHGEHIRIIYFDKDEEHELSRAVGKNFSYSLLCSRLLKKYIRTYKVDKVIVSTLMLYLPYCLFYQQKGVELRGVIYAIYLYRWSSMSLKGKLLNVFKYFVLKHSRCVESAFVLNDSASAKVLNKRYNTTKFKYLCDPYVPLREMQVDPLGKYDLPSQSIKFLHFGGLCRAKGTLILIEAIALLSDDALKRFVFIFAGKIHNDIRDEFYQRLDSLGTKAHIIVLDEYIEDVTLASLCSMADCFLLPYKRTSQSSGVIGYAAQYGKPVIAPRNGLLGKLVRKYRLGELVDNVNPLSIANQIEKFTPHLINGERYLQQNTVESFTGILLGTR